MPLNLYPEFVREGDLSPDASGSDIDEICQQINDSVKGFGTDEM
jgi:hypothetical protein